MGRPHIEPLVDRDVAPKSLALPGWSSGITYRTLSLDPVNGACTQVIEIEGSSARHGGGDEALMRAFLAAVAHGDASGLLSGPDEALESHLLAFAAEQARKQNRVVRLQEWTG